MMASQTVHRLAAKSCSLDPQAGKLSVAVVDYRQAAWRAAVAAGDGAVTLQSCLLQLLPPSLRLAAWRWLPSRTDSGGLAAGFSTPA